MEKKEIFINDFTQMKQLNRKFKEEVIILTICVCFAGFCGVELTEEIPPVYLKYKINDIFKSNHIAKVYEKLIDYSSKATASYKSFKNVFKNYSKEDFKNAIENLITELEAFPNYSSCESPESLNKLCISLLNPTSGSFYDGASGLGNSIIEEKKHSSQINVFGQEVNFVFHALCILRCYLYGIESENVVCGDTISEPNHTVYGGMLKKFDYSVMFPPIGVKVKNYETEICSDFFGRFYPTHSSSLTMEWFFIEHQLATLKDDGRGVSIVPSGCLYNSSSEHIREKIVSENVLECVISLPQNMLTYTKVPMNLLVFNKKKKSDCGILFIKGEELFKKYKGDYKKVSREIIEEISEIYRNFEEIHGISKIVDVKNFNEAVLLPGRYVTKPIKTELFGNIIVEEPQKGNWKKLKDTGKIYRGVNITAYSKSESLSEFKVINYTDVQNGELIEESVGKFYLNSGVNYEKNTVREGDILISCKGTSIKVCAVPPQKENLLLSVNFIGIRINKEKYDTNFVKYFLESPVGQSFLLQRQIGTSVFMLSAKDIAEIPIPDIPVSEQKKLVSELMEKEKIIYEQIRDLYSQSEKTKWYFYKKAGVTEIVKREVYENDINI